MSPPRMTLTTATTESGKIFIDRNCRFVMLERKCGEAELYFPDDPKFAPLLEAGLKAIATSGP